MSLSWCRWKVGLGTQINLFYHDSKWIEAVIVDITSTKFILMTFHDKFKLEIISILRKPDWINLIINNKLNIIKYLNLSENEYIYTIAYNKYTYVQLVNYRISDAQKTFQLYFNNQFIDIISTKIDSQHTLLITNDKDENKNIYLICCNDFKPIKNKEIEIFYQNKWYNAQIIDIDDIKISIKVWKSIFKVKTVEIERGNHWLYLIIKRRIIFKKFYAEWIKVGQSIWWYTKDGFLFPAKILKFKDGKNITIYYIEYNNNGYEQKVNCVSIKTVSKNSKNNYFYLHTLDGIIMYENYHIFDDLENKTFLKQLWSKQNESDNTKSTKNQIIPNNIKINHIANNNINVNKRRYCIVLQCKLFPVTINEIILSFLEQHLLYICPPIISIEKRIKWKEYPYQTLTFVNSKSAIIGLQFEMNRNLWIKGIELKESNIYNINKNKIHLIRYKSQQIGRWSKLEMNTAIIQSFECITDNQFLFDNLIQLQIENVFNEKYLYRLIIELYIHTEFHHFHDIKGSIGTITKQINWKCFKSIQWLQFSDNWNKANIIKKKSKGTVSASIFPHIAFMLL